MKTSSRRLLLPILFLTAFAAAPATSLATTSIEIRRELADRFLEILFEERYLGRLLNVAFDGLPVVGGKISLARSKVRSMRIGYTRH